MSVCTCINVHLCTCAFFHLLTRPACKSLTSDPYAHKSLMCFLHLLLLLLRVTKSLCVCVHVHCADRYMCMYFWLSRRQWYAYFPGIKGAGVELPLSGNTHTNTQRQADFTHHLTPGFLLSQQCMCNVPVCVCTCVCVCPAQAHSTMSVTRAPESTSHTSAVYTPSCVLNHRYSLETPLRIPRGTFIAQRFLFHGSEDLMESRFT